MIGMFTHADVVDALRIGVLLTPRTCLIVDDSRIIRKVARRIVEGLGFEVDEAADQLLTRARAAGLGWEDLLGLLGRRRDLLEGPPAPAGPGTGSAPRR